jgi:hypothetical protein
MALCDTSTQHRVCSNDARDLVDRAYPSLGRLLHHSLQNLVIGPSAWTNFPFAHLDYVPLRHQGPLLIFAALHLSKFNLLQPLKCVVNAFLTTELSHEALQFNLLLQALTLKYDKPNPWTSWCRYFFPLVSARCATGVCSLECRS